MQAVAEKMQQLKVEYNKLESSALNLIEANHRAIVSNPDLAYVEAGIKRINEEQRKGLPGQKAFHRYRYSSTSPDEINKLFMRCRRAFGPLAWAKAVNDPNREQQLRPIVMFSYHRILDSPEVGGKEGFVRALEQEGLTVFDPNDPNKSRLWQNLKIHMSETSDHWEPERHALIQEDIPDCIIEFAGKYDVHDASKEMYGRWLVAHVPDELVAAVRQFKNNRKNMMAIQGNWLSFAERVGCDTEQKRMVFDEAFELEIVLKEVKHVKRDE
jgi:hypothetical protein